jgi:hypothetical protein
MLKVSKSPEAHIRSGEAKRKGGSSLGHGIVMTLLVTLAACAGGAERKQASPTPEARAAAAAGFPLSAQLAIEGGMGVGGLATARAFEARAGGDIDPAPEGWSDLDLSTPPDLGLGPLSFEQAQRLNAYLPTSDGQVPATPFVLKANAAERARALLCLTQAIYYEAALEPTPGQEAVAQTVLNRVRHPVRGRVRRSNRSGAAPRASPSGRWTAMSWRRSASRRTITPTMSCRAGVRRW